MTNINIQTTPGLIILLAMAVLSWLAPKQSFAAPINAAGYYEEYKSKVCPSTPACVLTFTGIPAAKILILHTIACQIAANSTSPNIILFSLGGNGSTTHLNVPTSHFSVTNQKRWQTAQNVTKVYKTGNTPTVSLNLSSSVSHGLYCSIAGELK